MNSMKIGTYQMDTTFGLYLPEYTIPAPAVQTNFVKIIGRDGSVDLSNALGLHYDSRTWSLDFKCFDPTVNWHTLSSQVMNAIHGKRLNFEFDDDPNYFWTGRVSVQNYVSSHGTGTLKVTIVSDPFKYAKLSTIVTKTASTGTEYTGALVTFNTANEKINDLSVTMQPIQDLHGYDSPWPAGGGKNLFDCDTTVQAYITASGTESPSPYNAASDYILLKPNKDYCVSCNQTMHNIGTCIFNDTKTSVLSRDDHTNVQSVVISSSADTRYLRTWVNINNSTPMTVAECKKYEPQVEAGNTRTSFAPYSNICPISGRTGLSVYRTGKNLFDQSDTTYLAQDVRFYGANDNRALAQINTLPAGTYTLSFSEKIVSLNGIEAVPTRFGLYLEATNDGQTFKVNAQSALITPTVGQIITKTVTFTLTDECVGKFQDFRVYTGKNVSHGVPNEYTANIYDVQIELGSATTYEPYNGNTYAVDWTSQAGTVYHGTVDPVTGQLTVDMAKHVVSESDSHSLNQTMNENVYRIGIKVNSFTANVSGEDRADVACNIGRGSTDILSASASVGDCCLYPVGGNVYVLIGVPAEYNTATLAKQWLVDNNCEFVAKLATPITYQLSAQEIEALVGTNNVWSDGGNVTVAVVTPETLTNNGRAVVPTLTASADMVLKWGNYSASVQQGTSTIPQLILENGANLVYIIGTGSISFTWQEVRL